ncbi:MAG: sigma-54-dependent transcriptional regulator [Phycisphaerales bacterium]
MPTVLVVDDKEMLRDSVGVTLQRAGFTVLAAHGGEPALEMIARRKPDAVVTDLKMPGMTGVELLERVREFDDDLPVVLMTAYGTIESAVQAMKLGAYTYITKPFEGDELIVAVKRAIDHARLKRENQVLMLAGQPAGQPAPATSGAAPAGGALRGLDRIVGVSHAMRMVKEQVRAVAASHGTVLIHGESGVGKEVIARAIHECSARAGETMLAMNCAALSPSLLESELFGHEKGAFTGAEKLRKGRFELADRGTLLLDEISEVSPQIQAKLLRVLQERVFERVGSSTPIGVDVRVLATTNRDLPRAVERGEFRQDLYFRLNVLPLHIPALRDRAEDVPALAAHFIGMVCQREGRPARAFDDGAMALLQSYRWPGNVRELQNICERAVVLSRGESIPASLIAPWLGGQPSAAIAAPAAQTALGASAAPAPAGAGSLVESAPLHGVSESPRALEDIEREAIVRTLSRFNGHRQKTAEALGIGVRTLGLKLKKWKEANLVAPDL